MYNIPLIKPYMNDRIKQAVLDVLDSGYFTEGPVTKAFETRVAEYIGVNHALAVTSCTTGLEVALRAYNIGPGDEVIVPDYTYPATASVVNIVGATCVIVDVDPNTMLIDYDKLEAAITSKTKAIIPVSLFGNPLDYTRLNQIKKEHNLVIIEDAACSLGAAYNNEKVGTQADISVFSLHPRKFITTGEGGLITTNDETLVSWMYSYKHFGMSSNPDRKGTSFDIIGTNYKLSNIQAAVGLTQMEDIDTLFDARQNGAAYYTNRLKEINHPKINLPSIVEGGLHSYQSYCIFVSQRDQILKAMREKGIEVQIGTYALHKHTAFNQNPLVKLADNYPGSCYAFDQCLALPLYYDMTEQEQDSVIETLISLLS